MDFLTSVTHSNEKKMIENKTGSQLHKTYLYIYHGLVFQLSSRTVFGMSPDVSEQLDITKPDTPDSRSFIGNQL